MQLADVTDTQVMMRGGGVWAGALIAHLLTSFFAARRAPDGFIGFVLALGIFGSNALMLLGGGAVASATTSLVLGLFSHNLHEEVIVAICLAGGVGGMFAAAFSASLARNVGLRAAGVPAELVQSRSRWRPSYGIGAATRAERDQPYGIINKIAWIIIASVTGACLWRDASSWILLLLSSIIGGATVLTIRFRQFLLSPSNSKGDDYEGVFILVTFAPLGLALKAMYRFELIDWQLPLIIAAAVGLLATIVQIQPRARLPIDASPPPSSHSSSAMLGQGR